MNCIMFNGILNGLIGKHGNVMIGCNGINDTGINHTGINDTGIIVY